MEPNYSDRAHKELLIESWSNAARELVIRAFADGGPFAESHTTNADRSRAEDTFQLHGFPEGVQVSPLAAGVRRGECYVRVTLIMDGEPVLRLFSAYLTDGKTLSWPPGVHEGFTDGPGLPRSVAGTNPAAGVEITETVPTNARWKLKGVRAILDTDATVVDRRPALIIDDGANTQFFLVVEAVAAAGVIYGYTWGEGLTRETAFTRGDIEQPLPVDLVLFQGWRIRTDTENLQAGDDWLTIPYITVEEWIEE